MRPEREDVRGLFYRGETIAAENFDWNTAAKAREIEPHGLREAGKVDHHNDGFVFIAPQKREHFSVIGVKEFERAARKRLEIFSHRDDPAHPPKQRREILR